MSAIQQVTVTNIKGLTEEFFNCPDDNSDALLKILARFQTILSGAERFKRDAFLHLSDKGLNRLLSLLKNPKEEVRKNSFKVIAFLMNNSEILQNIFCEKFNFNPVGNVIVINWLPSELKKKLILNEHVLFEIKKTQNDNLGSNNRLYWQWPPNDKYNNDILPDPQKYLLGIYCSNRSIIPMEDKKFTDDFNIDRIKDSLEEIK
ncbi:MAG: hypothetical protein MJ252_25130 [archaeon]|nr:hypothetical protein [archaeon]